MEIGRASCRERVLISVVAVSLKKKKVGMIDKTKPTQNHGEDILIDASKSCESRRKPIGNNSVSSRRRHTRLSGDWSSDVCSSDLIRWPKKPKSPALPSCVGRWMTSKHNGKSA